MSIGCEKIKWPDFYLPANNLQRKTLYAQNTVYRIFFQAIFSFRNPSFEKVFKTTAINKYFDGLLSIFAAGDMHLFASILCLSVQIPFHSSGALHEVQQMAGAGLQE